MLTRPLLLSWDGTKMSASKDNYIGLAEEPEEMFGKAMRIPDSLLGQWYALLAEREPETDDPLQAKLALARFLVERSHGPEAARARRRRTSRASCARGRRPRTCPRSSCPEGDPVHLPALLAAHLGVASTSEARRLIAQGGVKVNGEPVTELDVPAGGARRSARPGRETPVRTLSRSLTSRGESCATIPVGCLEEAARRRFPSITGAPFGRIGYDLGTEQSEGLWRESEAFLWDSTAAPVFENSTACVYVETSSAPFGVPERNQHLVMSFGT